MKEKRQNGEEKGGKYLEKETLLQVDGRTDIGGFIRCPCGPKN